MTARAIGWLAGLLAFAVVGSVRAQECPTAQIGQACSGGTCLQATCSNTDVDGSTTTGSCGACVELEPNYCPPETAGQPCGDAGGVCDVVGAGGGGGSTTGAGPSSMISYSLGVCVIQSDASVAAADDAATREGIGDDASGTLGASDEDAAAHSKATTDTTSSGCAIASRDTGGLEPLALFGVAAALLRRRTKSGVRRAG
jgi:MYXO-CTERM domain-containing protein